MERDDNVGASSPEEYAMILGLIFGAVALPWLLFICGCCIYMWKNDLLSVFCPCQCPKSHSGEVLAKPKESAEAPTFVPPDDPTPSSLLDDLQQPPMIPAMDQKISIGMEPPPNTPSMVPPTSSSLPQSPMTKEDTKRTMAMSMEPPFMPPYSPIQKPTTPMIPSTKQPIPGSTYPYSPVQKSTTPMIPSTNHPNILGMASPGMIPPMVPPYNATPTSQPPIVVLPAAHTPAPPDAPILVEYTYEDSNALFKAAPVYMRFNLAQTSELNKG